jgi:NADH:ubiquinone reductase (H+-translocating)
LPPLQTTPSPGRPGGSGAGSPSGCGRRSTPPGCRGRPLGSLAAVGYEVVIAGGGFGGLYAARRLERRLPRNGARIRLVSDVNFLLYTPLLPGAAAGSLEPRHVVVPLREELAWTDIVLGRVTGADPAANQVRMTTVDGRHETLDYDQLIVTVGSVSRVLPIPGLAEHALGFKTLADAIALRNRALLNLEIAESLPDEDARRAYLSFVFVGAGYAGLEGIAELQDYVGDVIERYPRCRMSGTRFVLVEAQDRVMPETPASLAEFATRELRGRGMEIRTRTLLREMDERSATLSTGERIPTRMVCWTAGVKPAPTVRELGLPLDDEGRIEVDATMRVSGRDNVWAIGDAAAVPDPARRRKAASPPTAQHAIRQGRRVAENVAATLRGRRPKPFRYRTLGVFVDMGQHKAVATTLGVRLRGFPAWFAARTYHLTMMPGVARKVRLGLDWGVGLIFGRASAELGQLGHPTPLPKAEADR